MTITIDTLPIQHHWLPTLSNIVTSDDSFSRDLIKQFDKKRSKLQAEMAGDNISISSDSYLSRRTKTPELTSHPEVPQIITTTVNNKDDTASINIRRRSAGDLLRRSSAYLRAKFEAYKVLKQQQQDHQDMTPPPEEEDDNVDNDENDEEQVEQQQQQQQQTRSVFRSWSLSKKNKNNKSSTPHIEITDHQNNNNNNNNNINEKEINNNVHLSSSAIGSLSSSSFSSSTSLPPKKIAVNTTVLIPPPPSHQQYQYTPVQPPIITQYPPRPLKYSPVHPISDNDNEKKINPTTTTTTENRQSSIVDIQSRDIQKDTITKSHHYRRSLPLFKLIHDSTSSPPLPPSSSRHRRRSSESDIQPIPSSNQNHHPSFTNWTKTAKRFTYWLGCQPSKIVSKKGKERAKGLNAEKDPS
ncbi:unnamed protein product [Cunninghamella echinulata]